MIEHDCQNDPPRTILPKKSHKRPTTTPEDTIEVIPEPDAARTNPSCRAIERRSNQRPKSPIHRTFNCPKLKKCRLHRWHAIDSIRKTRSSALPTTQLPCDNWQPRVETVSSPDFTDGACRNNSNYDEEELRNDRKQLARLNCEAVCYDNVRWICVFLNLVLLILSILYFGSAVAFTISKDILLLTMREKIFISIITFFYVASLVFWTTSMSGLYLLWKMTRKIKIYVGASLILGAITASVIFLQSSTQDNIEANVQTQLTSSLAFHNDDNVRNSWHYFHNTFKCCGVDGFLDWCHNNDNSSEANETIVEADSGAYLCSSILNSCCASFENLQNINSNSNATCVKLYNIGCANSIRREVGHLGRMYKIMTGGASGTLILSAIVSMILYSHLTR